MECQKQEVMILAGNETNLFAGVLTMVFLFPAIPVQPGQQQLREPPKY